MKDEYNSLLRESMKKSMEYPAGHVTLSKKARRFFYRVSDEIGVLIWMLAVLAIGVGIWLAYGLAPR